MSYITVNDIFEELSEENKRLLNELLFANKCLHILDTFKSLFDFNCQQIKGCLDSIEWQKFNELRTDVEEVLKQKTKAFNRNPIKKKQNKCKDIIDFGNDIKHELNESINRSQDPNQLHQTNTENDNQSTHELSEDRVKRSDFYYHKMFVCDFEDCRQQLSGFIKFRTHVNTHRVSISSCSFDDCNYKSRTTKQLNQHLRLKHPNPEIVGCPKNGCKLKFHIDFLRRHLKLNHKMSPQFWCDINGCKQKFKKFDEYKNHLFTHPSYADQLKDRPNSKESVKIYVCRLENCGQELGGLKTYIKHRNKHIEQGDFKCSYEGCEYQCSVGQGREYSVHVLLRKHIERVHSTSCFKCDFEGCGKQFKAIEYLKEHQHIHTSLLNFKCDFEGCSKRFKTAKCRNTHKRLHSDLTFPCSWPGCDYVTKKKIYLKVHENIHKPEATQKKYVCDWPECGRVVRHKGTLVEHMRSHYNDKRYVCSWPGCTFRTVTTSSLAKHKYHHRPELRPSWYGKPRSKRP